MAHKKAQSVQKGGPRRDSGSKGQARQAEHQSATAGRSPKAHTNLDSKSENTLLHEPRKDQSNQQGGT